MSERRDGPDDRRARRKVHHLHPIPDPAEHPVKYRLLQARWKLALWTVVYPVQIALAVALAVCAVPMTMVLNQQSTLKTQNVTIQKQGRQNARLVRDIQTNRIATTKNLCSQLDRNARTSNAQLDLFKGIIVNGVKQSRPFAKLYRDLHLPPYSVRLKAANLTAKRINRLKLPLPNCTSAVFNVQTNTPPPPPPRYNGPH